MSIELTPSHLSIIDIMCPSGNSLSQSRTHHPQGHRQQQLRRNLRHLRPLRRAAGPFHGPCARKSRQQPATYGSPVYHADSSALAQPPHPQIQLSRTKGGYGYYFNAVLYASVPEMFYRASASGMISCLDCIAGILDPIAG